VCVRVCVRNNQQCSSTMLMRRQQSAICGELSSLSHGTADTPYALRSTIPFYRYKNQTHPIEVVWYNDIADIPNDKYSMIIANEFIDALPVHQFHHVDGKWRELIVDFNRDTDSLVLLNTNDETIAAKAWITVCVLRFKHLFISQKAIRADTQRRVHEVCTQAGVVVNQLYDIIERNGGAVLITDYGHNGVDVCVWVCVS
jgi:hypothetical protein